MAVVTLEQVKAQLGMDPAVTDDDEELQLYMSAGVTAVEDARGEVVEQRTVTDEMTLQGRTAFLLRSTPVTALIAVQAVDGSQSWDVSSLHVDADSGLVTVLSGPPVTGLVTVAYTAGPATAPSNYQLATLIVIQHLWETQRGSMGVQLGGEGEIYTPGRGFAIPRRAVELLGLSMPGVA